MPSVDPADIPTPHGLDEYATFAWNATIRTLAPTRVLSHADLLALEAACKSWSRWRVIDNKISEMSAQNPLAGEISKDAKGNLAVSPLRNAANEAFRDFLAIAQDFGIAVPGLRFEPGTTDLFGNPVADGKGKPGRPRTVASPRDRDRVKLLLAMGWPNGRIAAALEMSEPTFRREFRSELRARYQMRDRLDARRLEIAMEQANDGNIGALKELGRMIDESERRFREEEMRRRQAAAKTDQSDADEDPAPKRYVGKKEMAAAAARRVLRDDEWGDDLSPGVYRQ